MVIELIKNGVVTHPRDVCSPPKTHSVLWIEPTLLAPREIWSLCPKTYMGNSLSKWTNVIKMQRDETIRKRCAPSTITELSTRKVVQ